MVPILKKIADAWLHVSATGTQDRDYDESTRIVLCNQIAFLIVIVSNPPLLIGPSRSAWPECRGKYTSPSIITGRFRTPSTWKKGD